MTAHVIPFRRPGTPAAAAVLGEAGLHPRTRRAPAPARRLVVEQQAPAKGAYARAAAEQHEARLLASGRVVPARISLALDAIGAFGPEVDRACGAEEPDVDRWENGELQPTAEQVRLLAEYTGQTIPWFYEPLPAGPLPPAGMFVCFRGRGKGDSGWIPPDVIDERGVLLPGGEPRPPIPPATQPALFDPPAPPRRAPARRAPSTSRTSSPANTTRAAGPSGQGALMPPGRLAEKERALLMQKLAEAKEALRGRQ